MKIKNSALLVLLNKAGDLVTEVREIGKKIQDLEEKRQSLAIKHQKVKEEILPIVQPYYKDLKEFEDVVGVEVILDEKKKPTKEIEIKVIDRLEEWKRLFAEEKAKATKPAEKKESK